MTPTLMGRIQTRLFLLGTVGLVWTLLVTPFLPRASRFVDSGDLYPVTLRALFWTALIGVVLWEPLYHFAQQWRWEKDWPISLGMVTGIPEGILVFNIISNMMNGRGATTGTFVWHFATTWVLVWIVANGPLRAVFVRWRYRGGRIV